MGYEPEQVFENVEPHEGQQVGLNEPWYLSLRSEFDRLDKACVIFFMDVVNISAQKN